MACLFAPNDDTGTVDTSTDDAGADGADR
jgi:hypothetical protein